MIMRQAALIDWMVGQDLTFNLRRATPNAFECDPLLDPRYDSLVGRTSSDEERSRQVERLRRRVREA